MYYPLLASFPPSLHFSFIIFLQWAANEASTVIIPITTYRVHCNHSYSGTIRNDNYVDTTTTMLSLARWCCQQHDSTTTTMTSAWRWPRHHRRQRHDGRHRWNTNVVSTTTSKAHTTTTTMSAWRHDNNVIVVGTLTLFISRMLQLL